MEISTIRKLEIINLLLQYRYYGWNICAVLDILWNKLYLTKEEESEIYLSLKDFLYNNPHLSNKVNASEKGYWFNVDIENEEGLCRGRINFLEAYKNYLIENNGI